MISATSNNLIQFDSQVLDSASYPKFAEVSTSAITDAYNNPSRSSEPTSSDPILTLNQATSATPESQSPYGPPRTNLHPINVSSFNVRYSTALDTHATINNLTEQGLDGAAASDIILLQEVTWQTTGNIIHQTQDTHTTFLGEGYDGETNGEFSPVLYNHERFDAVYTEHLPLHNKGDYGAGTGRVANFVLLKDKLTGGTVLVVNCHLDNKSAEAREFAKEKIQDKIDSIKSEYPVDTVMWGGDINDAEGVTGYEEPSADTTPAGNGHRDLDHLYIDSASDSMWAGSYAIQDGGASDHDVYTGTLAMWTGLDSKEDRAGLTNQNSGVLLYGDRVSTDKNKNYEGDFLLVGYGAPDIRDQQRPRFSDVSGMYVSEGSSVTVQHNENGPDNNKTEEYEGFVPWVGTEHNDQFSLVQVNDGPTVDIRNPLIGRFKD